MADPKYANLPGIAVDQADFYETEDLPESDQYIDFAEEDISPNIDRPNISVEAAFERFRTQRVSGEADFEVNRGYRTAGLGDIIEESTAQKLARLRLEITELGEALRTQPPADKTQLTDFLSLEQDLGKLVKREKTDTVLLQKKLQGLSDGAGPAGSGLQYELCLEKAASTPGGAGQRATELEARIQRLEKILGNSKDSLAPLGLQPKNKSVLGALTDLHTKLSLLEPSHIELIESKLSAVLQKVTKIVEKKLDVQELERSLKLSSLYDLLESSSSTIEALPELSMRLEALRDLHNQASDVIRELGHTKSVQDGIAAGTAENDKLLKELKEVLISVVGDGK